MAAVHDRVAGIISLTVHLGQLIDHRDRWNHSWNVRCRCPIRLTTTSSLLSPTTARLITDEEASTRPCRLRLLTAASGSHQASEQPALRAPTAWHRNKRPRSPGILLFPQAREPRIAAGIGVLAWPSLFGQRSPRLAADVVQTFAGTLSFASSRSWGVEERRVFRISCPFALDAKYLLKLSQSAQC